MGRSSAARDASRCRWAVATASHAAAAASHASATASHADASPAPTGDGGPDGLDVPGGTPCSHAAAQRRHEWAAQWKASPPLGSRAPRFSTAAARSQARAARLPGSACPSLWSGDVDAQSAISPTSPERAPMRHGRSPHHRGCPEVCDAHSTAPQGTDEGSDTSVSTQKVVPSEPKDPRAARRVGQLPADARCVRHECPRKEIFPRRTPRPPMTARTPVPCPPRRQGWTCVFVHPLDEAATPKVHVCEAQCAERGRHSGGIAEDEFVLRRMKVAAIPRGQ